MRTRPITTGALAALLAALAAPDAGARKVRQARAQQDAEKTLRGIEAWMGDFRWGAAGDDIQVGIIDALRADYDERVKATRDQMLQHKLREELGEKVKEVEGSRIEFDATRTGWDSAIIADEFAHGNGESLLYRWEPDQRRFFFFHQGKLYKMFLALSAEKFKGKGFLDILDLFRERYGPASEGDEPGSLAVTWGPVNGTSLSVVDKSEFFGSFCIRLTHVDVERAVLAGRAANAPEGKQGDPLVDAVLAPASEADANEDIIDRITGVKVQRVDARQPDEKKGKKKAGPAPAPAAKKSKLHDGDPLDNL